MEWGKQQLDIFDSIHSNKNIIVNADAGTGKSTVIFGCLDVKRVPSLLLSFNTSIAKENSARIKENNITDVNVFTFHSYGLKTIPRYAVNPNKILDTMYNKNFQKQMGLKSHFLGSIIWILKELRGKGFIVSDVKSLEDELTNPEFLDCPLYLGNDINLIYDLLCYFDQMSLRGRNEVDFDDMCRLPVIHNLIKPCHLMYDIKNDIKYDVIYVDEIQDLSDLQINMLKLMMQAQPNVQVIAVGDVKQSIYGFRGARNSFDKVFHLLNEPTILPLQTTYRCPSKIVDFVNMKVKASNMKPYIMGGSVIRYYGTKEDPLALNEWLSEDIDMIISTRNSTLLNLWIDLLNHDYDCSFKGKSLVNSMRSLMSAYPTQDFVKFKHEIIKLSRKKKNLYADVARSILILIDKLEIKTIYELKEVFSLISQNTHNGVSLETVHSAKGREADTTLFIWDFWTKDQKMETKYVALTRAKKKLICIIPYK